MYVGRKLIEKVDRPGSRQKLGDTTVIRLRIQQIGNAKVEEIA